MTALTRMTKAQLIELAQRLTAENEVLHAAAARTTDECVDARAQLNTLRAEHDALKREVSSLRAEHQDVVAPVTPAPSRKLREPNETELRRLAIIDECHRLTKLHRSTVWYDWKYGEFRTRRDGAIQVLEVQPCAAI